MPHSAPVDARVAPESCPAVGPDSDGGWSVGVIGAVAAGVVGLLGALVLAGVGGGADGRPAGHAGVMASVFVLAQSAPLAGLYVCAGAGLGVWTMRALGYLRVPSGFTSPANDHNTDAGARTGSAARGPELMIAVVGGAGCMLWVSQVMGLAGLLGRGWGSAAAWASMGALAICFGAWATRGARTADAPSTREDAPARSRARLRGAGTGGGFGREAGWAMAIGVAGGVGVAAMVAAACSPPGWLWESEAGGYDVLSYHLQLVKEWLALGAIRPLEHNVYSYLPGLMESGFLHLCAAAGALAGPGEGGGVLGADGLGLHASQFLHAIWSGLCAWAVAWCARLTCARVRGDSQRAALGCAGRDDAGVGFGGLVSGAVVLATPWVVVTGSMAYNEMGMCGLIAACAAWLLREDAGRRPARDGIVAGVLLGLACGCKPTAAFFGTVLCAGAGLCGVLSGAHAKGTGARLRAVARIAIGGTIGGAIAVVPWVARNWIVSGNPVFPAATGFFGSAHWDTEQVERFARAHAPEGTFADRAALLLSSDRGFLHPQWAAAFATGIAAIIVCLVMKRTRRAGGVLSVLLVGVCLAWMVFTHNQARFLMPAVIVFAVAVGVAVDGAAARAGAAHESGAIDGREAGSARSMPARAGATTRTWVGAKQGAVGLVGLAAVAAFGVASVRGFVGQRQSRPNALLSVGVAGLTGSLWAKHHGDGVSISQREMVRNLGVPAATNLTLMPWSDGDADHAAPSGEREGGEGIGGGGGEGGEGANGSGTGGARASVILVGDATPLYFTGRVLYATTWDRSRVGVLARSTPGRFDEWSRTLAREGVLAMVVNYAEIERLEKDGWWDREVKPEHLDQWVRSGGWRVMYVWEHTGQMLAMLDGAGRSGEVQPGGDALPGRAPDAPAPQAEPRGGVPGNENDGGNVANGRGGSRP